MTPDTDVQVPAPAGLDRRLYVLAALCVPSVAGAAQVTVRFVPLPWASVAAAGVFGALGVATAVVSVLVADQTLAPAALKL